MAWCRTSGSAIAATEAEEASSHLHETPYTWYLNTGRHVLANAEPLTK